MKMVVIMAVTLSSTFSLFAQNYNYDRPRRYGQENEERRDRNERSDEDVNTHKFRKDNIFIGGSIGLVGLSGGAFSAGANPEVGYTIAKWLDAGISTNFNYQSYSAEYNGGIRQRSFNYGGGIFARVFLYKGLFLEVLPEYNRVNTNFKDFNSGSIGSEYKFHTEAPSLLLGIGYSSRIIGRMNYFTMLMFDAGSNTNSPYIDSYGKKLPILRTGFNFYLHPSRK